MLAWRHVPTSLELPSNAAWRVAPCWHGAEACRQCAYRVRCISVFFLLTSEDMRGKQRMNCREVMQSDRVYFSV